MVRLLLLRGGVEKNPGPGRGSGGWKTVSSSKKSSNNKKSNSKNSNSINGSGCFLCGGDGHRAASCQRGPERRCFSCGSTKHLAAGCPKDQQQQKQHARQKQQQQKQQQKPDKQQQQQQRTHGSWAKSRLPSGPELRLEAERCLSLASLLEEEEHLRASLAAAFFGGGAFRAVCGWCGSLVPRPSLAQHMREHVAMAQRAFMAVERTTRSELEDRILAELTAWPGPPGLLEQHTAARQQAAAAAAQREAALSKKKAAAAAAAAMSSTIRPVTPPPQPQKRSREDDPHHQQPATSPPRVSQQQQQQQQQRPATPPPRVSQQQQQQQQRPATPPPRLTPLEPQDDRDRGDVIPELEQAPSDVENDPSGFCALAATLPLLKRAGIQWKEPILRTADAIGLNRGTPTSPAEVWCSLARRQRQATKVWPHLLAAPTDPDEHSVVRSPVPLPLLETRLALALEFALGASPPRHCWLLAGVEAKKVFLTAVIAWQPVVDGPGHFFSTFSLSALPADTEIVIGLYMSSTDSHAKSKISSTTATPLVEVSAETGRRIGCGRKKQRATGSTKDASPVDHPLIPGTPRQFEGDSVAVNGTLPTQTDADGATPLTQETSASDELLPSVTNTGMCDMQIREACSGLNVGDTLEITWRPAEAVNDPVSRWRGKVTKAGRNTSVEYFGEVRGDTGPFIPWDNHTIEGILPHHVLTIFAIDIVQLGGTAIDDMDENVPLAQQGARTRGSHGLQEDASSQQPIIPTPADPSGIDILMDEDTPLAQLFHLEEAAEQEQVDPLENLTELLTSKVATHWEIHSSQLGEVSLQMCSLLAPFPAADAVQRRKIWADFLAFPKKHLRKGKVGAARSGWHPPMKRPTPSEDKQRATAVAAASTFIKKGYLSRAAAALDRCHDPLPDNVIEKLQRLHPGSTPEEKKAVASLLAQHAATIPLLTADNIPALLKKSKHAKAPGLSGWTEELLLAAVATPGGALAVTHMVLCILNNDIDEDLAALLRAARLIAIPKPKGGVRPISVGEAIVRLAGLVLLSQSAELLKDFENHGKMCFVDGGTEIIIHDLRTRFTDGDLIVSVDFKNAFNSILVSAFAKELALPEWSFAWRFFTFEYGLPSSLYYMPGETPTEIIAESGVKQGGVTSPLYYALGMRTLLRDAKRLFPHVKTWAFCDDVSGTTGRQHAVELAGWYIFVRTEGRKRGLIVNDSKSCVSCADIAAGMLLAEHIGIPFSSTLIALGAAIGSTDETAAFCAQQAESKTSNLDLMQELPPQEALLLLRNCTVPRLGHMVRVHPPEATGDAAALFDARIFDTLAQCCGFPALTDADSDIVSMVRIPIREGGLGIRSLTEIRWGAYSSSSDPSSNGQAVLTDEVDQGHITRIDENAFLSQLRKENKETGASDWLGQSEFHWNPSAFSAAVRLRCAVVEATKKTHAPCDGCSKVFDLQDGSWRAHVLGCARRSGWNVSARHRLVNDAVAAAISALGIPNIKSPSVGKSGFADLRVELHRNVLLADWTFVSTMCGSKPTVEGAEGRKANKYAALGDSTPATVNTLAVKVSGGCSKNTLRCLRLVADECRTQPRQLRCVLSCALQQGNGLLWMGACRAAGITADTKFVPVGDTESEEDG